MWEKELRRVTYTRRIIVTNEGEEGIKVKLSTRAVEREGKRGEGEKEEEEKWCHLHRGG